MGTTGAKKPTFLWRGILILFPVVLLAGAGLYSLRQDRLLAEVEARQRCHSLVENYAGTISAGLSERMGNAREIRLDGNGDLVEIDLHPAKMPRDPIPHPLPLASLTHPQFEAWQAAQRAEFSGADATSELRDFLGRSPPSPFLTQARYDLALLLARRHEKGEAGKLFAEVQTDHAAETESGLPLWLLAELQQAELSLLQVTEVYSNAVNNPTFAAPVILSRLSEFHPDQKWIDQWEQDEAGRDFYLRVRAGLANSPLNQPFWIMCDGEEVLGEPGPVNGGGSTVRRLAKDDVSAVVQNVLTNSFGQPRFAQVGVSIAGKPMLAADFRWPVLAVATNGMAIVSESLSQPNLFYAQQRKRTAWFAALILMSTLAATVGFVSAYRGFHQQLRLSEMKSNFVSSVSHELRAPIASMRLLAESLERGKVADPVKQKEYFGFLVQESRRLSSLIENILDFSRIEQGRKQYQFEPTDLNLLLAQTINLMKPCGAERGVALQRVDAGNDSAAVVHCDGLAIQQALINLIDNAIKHSPSGAVVMIGAERAPGVFRLWVEDAGPGIPPEDHERIFDLFYRRGSELRRETQGIGIGLTIVKHTMSAHGGRVIVRSAVGQGSRFTMELPDSPRAKEET